jgi:chromosome segregation protein
MYLKSLTMLGFKSFADKTPINFLPGATAIVGPNGCGKSNVSDAIRWVLGEQSAKALRGGEMADVIFNGTDGRKPLSMAEVSLTLGDVDAEHLKTAGVDLDFNEVTVTRRIFRDGGSEYFINKTGCRLKDIQQLFAGTGMGKASYSIMAQGNITQILSSKPDDRRLVFEEAAGITKFKAQKKEALRKLEHTDQNLLRVEDLIREVKRQIGSLQRQAGKARRFKAIQTELQQLDTQLARHQFDILQREITERQTGADRAKLELEISQASVIRCDDEVVLLRTRQSELEAEISMHQQEGMELKAGIDRHDNRVRVNEERLLELEEQNLKALQEIAEAEERQRTAEAELVQVSERLAVAQEQLTVQRAAVDERRQTVQEMEGELSTLHEQLRSAQSAAFGNAQQLSRARNEINALDVQQQGNIVRLEKLNAEKLQTGEESTHLEVRLAEFSANVETEKLNVQTARGTLEERQQRLREIQVEINQAAQTLDHLVRQQAEKKSRLNVLEQLDTQHEGFSQGALAALKQSQNVLGSLADSLRVPDQYIVAVESALGLNLQLVLTEQPESANTILDDLRNHKKGKASIAALALRSRLGFQPDPLGTEPGSMVPSGTGEGAYATNATPALSVVQCDDSVRPLVEALLGRTLIVESLAIATAAWKETNGAHDFVTLDGELLNRYGVFTGGANGATTSGKAPSSILGRKNQIAELQSQLAALAAQVDEAIRGKAALQSEQTAIQASLEQARSELRQQEVAIASREGEFRALQNSQRQLTQKLQNVTHELNALAGQDQQAADKRAQFAARISELESQEESLAGRVAELTAELEQQRQMRDAANAALTEARVTLTGEEQQAGALGRQRIPLEARIRELGQLIETRRREGGSFLARKEQFETEIADSRQEISRLAHEREQNNVRLTDLIEQKREQDVQIASREEELRAHRGRLMELQTLGGRLEVELTQKTMAVQNLRERIQQKYQLNLDDVRSECITLTDASEGGQAKVETLTPEEMQARGLSTDWRAVAEQVSQLQKRIDEMGPVNLVAIEEYDETEQRHIFLTTQVDDLVKAKAELMDVLNRINTQTKEMFLTTFTQIRDNFRLMFSEIFGGGKADLILQEGEDLLEAGIEIVARPPGKQLQTISLLSGGEQTMTAVALLFSIYQVKPSPFCVLDELDAPLDESNINRFIKVLQRFLGQSQFIIITHSKRTISMADALYGVTMQEHGVSKIVSVKFHKTDGQTDQQNARLLVPEKAEEPAAFTQ